MVNSDWLRLAVYNDPQLQLALFLCCVL